jgi:hypothetical protein
MSLVLERTGDRYEWRADGTIVAAASTVHGLWQIVDARGRHVVTLMPLSPTSSEDRPGLALVGPAARLLGTIHRGSAAGHDDTAARDDNGETVLVLRIDGPSATHVVDRHGDVVAVSSTGERAGVTDVVITATGTCHSLAMVFGLVLTTELYRQAGHRPA